jgi:hypothetical protein
MKILTGFAIIKDSVGHRITYTHSEVDEKGTIISSNNKESFIVLDAETKGLISGLENKINERFL